MTISHIAGDKVKEPDPGLPHVTPSTSAEAKAANAWPAKWLWAQHLSQSNAQHAHCMAFLCQSPYERRSSQLWQLPGRTSMLSKANAMTGRPVRRLWMASGLGLWPSSGLGTAADTLAALTGRMCAFSLTVYWSNPGWSGVPPLHTTCLLVRGDASKMSSKLVDLSQARWSAELLVG